MSRSPDWSSPLVLELVLVLLLTAIGAAERLVSSRRWDAERRNLLTIVTAAKVSDVAAASAARTGATPSPTKDEPRPVPIDL